LPEKKTPEDKAAVEKMAEVFYGAQF
jgi:hypothetical protein